MFEIPRASTTMIGSMPGDSAEAAFALLDKSPLSLPTWCQLPKRSIKERMIPQCSEGFPGMVIDEAENRFYVDMTKATPETLAAFYEEVIAENLDAFTITGDCSAGLEFFLDRLAADGTHLPIIKGQATGPFTFGLGLNDQDGVPVWFNPEYQDVVMNGLKLKARWQAKRLGEFADNVILFMDEPILSALGTPAYVSVQDSDVTESMNDVIGALHAEGAAVGTHCCGNMDWGLLASTDIDIIAFDAYFYGDKVALYHEAVQAFLSRGGYLAWGIVPTAGHGDEENPAAASTADSLKAKLDELVAMFTAKGISEDLLRTQMILTPSCGMGTMSTESTEHVLSLLESLKDY